MGQKLQNMIDRDGIPAIGLPPKKKKYMTNKERDDFASVNPLTDQEEADKLAQEAYEAKTTL